MMDAILSYTVEPLASLIGTIVIVLFTPIQKIVEAIGLIKIAPFIPLVIVFCLFISFKVSGRWATFYSRSSSGRYSSSPSRSRSAFKLLHLGYFFGCPLAIIAFVAMATFGSSTVPLRVAQKVVPAMWSDYDSSSIEAMLPVHPKSLSEAFEYGKLVERADACDQEKANNKNENSKEAEAEHDKCIAGVLKETRRLVNGGYDDDKNIRLKRNVSRDELKDLASTVRDLDNHKGPWQRVVSMFSIVGFLWFLSIVGICALVIPFVGIVFGSLITKFFVKMVFPVFIAICNYIIIPFGGVILYTISFMIYVESTRYPTNDLYALSGTMYGLFSVGLFIAAWVYSASQLESDGSHTEQFLFMTGFIHATFSVCLAATHHSKLIALVATAALTLALCFSFLTDTVILLLSSGGRGNYYHHHVDDEIIRFLSGCFYLQLLGAIFSSSALATSDTAYFMMPFQEPIVWVGTTGFFWVFVITIFFSRSNFHPLFLVTVLGYIITGLIFNMIALTQVACFYFGVYMIGFIIIGAFECNNIVVGGFLTSVLLFIVANVLSKYPQILSFALGGQ